MQKNSKESRFITHPQGQLPTPQVWAAPWLPSEDDSIGNFLAVQWLGLRAFTAEGQDSIPGQGTKIEQAALCAAKKERKKQTQNKKKPKEDSMEGEGKVSLHGGETRQTRLSQVIQVNINSDESRW